MNLAILDNEKSTVYPSLCALRDIMNEVGKRHGSKMYLDSVCDFGVSWTDTKVYIHGDRNVVNLVCIRLIAWQHKHLGPCDHYLYAYPAEVRNEKVAV